MLLAAVKAFGEAILIPSANLAELGPRIACVNPACTRMTGYDADEILGRKRRLLQGRDAERDVLDRMHAALAAGETFQADALNYRKNRSTCVVEWLVVPVRAPDGRITRWVSTQRAVTEWRVAQDRRNLMVAELRHRVRNTLATVQAVLEGRQDSTVDPDEFRH